MTAIDTAEPEFDVLLQLIIRFLAPLFPVGCSGDADLARLTALAAVTAYHGRTQADLVKSAQSIAFSMAALDNLRLSMTADLPLPLVLRLRSGANALNRVAQQNEKALARTRSDAPQPAAPTAGRPDAAPVTWAAPDLEVPSPDAPVTITQPAHDPAKCDCRAQPRVVSQPRAESLSLAEPHHDLKWAKAMRTVAAELASSLASAPTAQRHSDRMWATALSSNASSLAIAAGSIPQGANIGIERVDKRSKPA